MPTWLLGLLVQVVAACPPDLDAYNLVWSSATPAEFGASGSLPIGNGQMGANVWVEQDGDLLALLSRTDAWSEADRLLKLGRLRIHVEPNPFAAGQPFRQELKLREGRIEWTAGQGERAHTIALWIDAESPVLRVEAQAKGESSATYTVSLESWRRQRRVLSDDVELQSSWTMHSAPPDMRPQAAESADVFGDCPGRPDVVLWYHRNEHSVVPLTLQHQGLASLADQFRDPLLHRTFGGVLECAGGSRVAPDTLVVRGRSLSLRVTTHCAQTATAGEWVDAVNKSTAAQPDAARSKSRTAQWWRAFWDRSWIFIEGDSVSASGHAVPSNAYRLRVGADQQGGNVFRGRLSHLAIYDAPLDAAQAGDLPAAPPRPAPSWSWPVPWTGADATRPPVLTAVGSARAATREDGEAFLSLDGGWFELSSAQAPDFGRGVTLFARIESSADLGAARIFDKITPGGADGFLLDTHPGDSLRWIVGDRIVQAPGVLKGRSAARVAATYDASTGRAALFLDGRKVAEGGPRWSDPAPPSRVTQAYILQRWVQACGGRGGEFPIKFNGSIFTVEPRHTQGQPYDADWRRWGGCYWWQNTRLPYYPMLASGDFDLLDPLFRFYENALPGCVARAKLYYNADGVYFPETMTTFATYGNGDYGWKRAGLAPGDISPCPWWQWAWNQSLELTLLMLDYAAYTGDQAFLRERALPMARATLAYFDTRFGRDAAGKLVVSPTQAVETYWHDVVNDAPSVAGLHAVCDRLLALPSDVGASTDRELWRRMKDAVPPLPTREVDGRRVAAPAERYRDQRSNCETPELYPVFPFRLYGLGKPDLDLAIEAYHRRVDRSTVGWTQDGLFAALLGLTDEARANLRSKVANSHPNHRFPASWGPNFDWLPDQDHGSNLLTGLQLMLLQCDPVSGEIRLLPAWPSDWSARFKLHAPHQTVVEGRIEGGKLVELKVEPASRRKDVRPPP